MNTYKITIKFKNNQTLNIEAESDTDPRDIIRNEWPRDGVLYVGDYTISAADILWIKVEGNPIEKPEKIEE
jgi:hypothetical protein